MNPLAALQELDANIHAAFAAAGFAFNGMYTAPGSSLAVACEGYLDLGVQVVGTYEQVSAKRDEMRLLLGTIVPAKDGRVFIEGVEGSGIGETYKLVSEIGNDGSAAAWVVRRV